MGIWTPSNTQFIGATQVNIPNGIMIGSATFAALTVVTIRDRQTNQWTDHATPSVAIGRIYLASAVLQPPNNVKYEAVLVIHLLL